MYAAIVTKFSLHADGRWKTTGEQHVLNDIVDKAAAEAIVAEYGGDGVGIVFFPADETYDDEGQVEIGGTDIAWESQAELTRLAMIDMQMQLAS